MGAYTNAQIQLALDIGEWLAEDYLCTSLTPTQETEEYPWPFQKALQLKKRRIITVDTITALHYLDCEASWTTTDENAAIFDALMGIINPIACGAFPCCTARGRWCGCDCPARIRVTYTAGFPSGFFTGKIGSVFTMAVCQLAKWLLPEITDLLAAGEKFITSWSSMDYSESYSEAADWLAAWSKDPRVVQALNLLRKIKGYRFVGITGRGYP